MVVRFDAVSMGVTRLDGAWVKEHVWRPMFEHEVFRKQESTCDIVRTFRRPHNDSAPGELCPILPPSLHLWQSDCFYPSLFFEHYNHILHCDWVLGRYSVYMRACAYHSTFVFDRTLDQGWTQCPILDVVLYQVLRVNDQ